MLIYLAGPLFSQAERSANVELARVLSRWSNVFLPQRDGHLLPELIASGMPPIVAYQVIFEKDIDAVRRCDAIVINLDGRTVDEGAAFELGLAFALNKVCVGFHTDTRVLLPWGINPMIRVPLSVVLRDHAELETWVRDFSDSAVDNRQHLIVR